MTVLITRRDFLGTMGVLWASNRAFGKRPGSDCERYARFVFYTDVHARSEWDTPDAMMRAAYDINRTEPEFIIAGGDLITDGFQSSAERVRHRWDEYMRMQEALEAPVYPVIGNHDLVAAMPEDGSPPAQNPRAVFLEAFKLERTYRSFDRGGYHFILLDSMDVTGGAQKYRAFIDPEQVAWLMRDLEAVPRDTPIVLVTHIPMFTTFLDEIQDHPARRVVQNAGEILNLFSEHKLLLVLQGHTHIMEHVTWRGVEFISGGAVCGKWWRGPWYGTEEGFGVVTLCDDDVSWEYIDYGWKERRPVDQ